MSTIHSEAMLFHIVLQVEAAEAGSRLFAHLWRRCEDSGDGKTLSARMTIRGRRHFPRQRLYNISRNMCAKSLEPASAVLATVSPTANSTRIACTHYIP